MTTIESSLPTGRARERLEGVTRYLKNEFQSTEGWCSPYVWQVIEPLMMCHEFFGFSAPVAEIGPYQGKFFWGLVKSSPASLGHLAVDIFDQGENPDGSGVVGNLRAFLANGELAGESPSRVALVEGDSMTLSATDLKTAAFVNQGFGFFSVDGSHRKENVRHDIYMASELTHQQGLIVVDDYGNPRWHGVQEAVAEIYLKEALDFVPLAYIENKLFLCHHSMLAQYASYLSSYIARCFPTTKVFETTRFGHEGLTVIADRKTSYPTSLYLV